MSRRCLPLLFAVLWLCASLLAGARPVDGPRAAVAASAWAAGCAAPLAGAQATRSAPSVREVRPYLATDGRLLAHIVDLAPAGFVLLAPDDTLAPVLAYGAVGRFAPEDARCRVLADLVAADVPARLAAGTPEPGAGTWDSLTRGAPLVGAMAVDVSPLLDTTWGQGSPYNRYTPNNWVTGCTATALAQIIRYHQYPATASGSGTVYVNSVAQSASFSRGYDFTQMPAALSAGSTEAQKDQVAHLMADCGIAVRTNYTPTVSYASVVTAIEGLTTMFGYATAEWKDADDADWRTALATELQAGYPVEMSIQDSATNEGHAIVCDGLAHDGASTLYHLNMGWDGYADAWYAVPGFDTMGNRWDVLHGFLYKVRPTVPQDAFEPDNTPAAAKALASGVPQTRSLHKGTDSDWATFTLTGTSNIVLEVTGASYETGVYLYGPNSSTSKINTAFPASGSSTVRIERTALPAGVYYVQVANLLEQSGLETYGLSLAVDDDPRDNYEPDDTAASAKTLPVAVLQQRSLHVAGDVDWATFTLPVRSDLIVETDGSSGDTELWLFGPNSSTTQVGYDDDGGTGAFSRVSRTNLAAGTYYVKVTSYHGQTSIGAYLLALAVTPLESPLTGVTLEGAPSPPVVQGAPTVLMATPVGGTGLALEYRFVARNTTAGGWSLIREWGASPNCLTWQPAPASWSVYVYCREQGSTTQQEAHIYFRVKPPLTAVVPAVAPVAKGVTGRKVVMAGTATGGAIVDYRFVVTNAQGGTVYTRAFNANRSTWWYPTDAGTYTIAVTARDGFDLTEKTSTLPFEVCAPMSAVTVGGVPPSTFPTGQKVTLSATVTGGATPEYRFLFGYRPTAQTPVGQTVWNTSMAYRPYSTTQWTPNTAGVWTVRAYAREKGTTAAYEVGQDVQCTVTAALTDFTIAVSPAHAGQAAAITASPAGGVSLRWKFYARPQGGTTWTLVHDYQPGASAPWTPPTSGAWEVMVYAKEAASAKYYDLSRTTVVGVE